MKIAEPAHCPYCGAETVRLIDDGANIYCSNINCPGRNLEKLKYFVSKECMNIDGISGKTLEKLLSNNVHEIHSWWDLYSIPKETFMSIGLGEKTSVKLVNELKKSREINADKVLSALSIPMIGQVNAKKLLERFGSIENIEDIACSDKSSLIISEIGEVAGGYIIDYMKSNHDKDSELSFVYKFLNTIYEKETAPVKESSLLNGLVVLATGVFDNFSRGSIKESVIANGAKYGSGVNGKLSFLIVGHEPGPSKIAKAKELGIRMVSESEYIEMIGFSCENKEVKAESCPDSNGTKSLSLF